MNIILSDAGWLELEPSEIRQEQIKQGIRKRTIVKGIGKGLLRIEHLDNDPARAFITAKR